MTQQDIEKFVEGLENVQRTENFGYILYFFGEYRMVPFTSIAEPGNKYEEISKLDREGVFRVNIGVSKKTFDSLFPDKDLVNNVDFSELDVFMPHPHYAKQFYICILNPSEKNDEQLKKFILEAYSIAKSRPTK